MNDLIERYLACWNERDEAARRSLVAQTWTEDARYTDPMAHQQARFRWGLGPAAQEPVIVGFDVAVTAPDGRISSVLGFLDRVPS